MLLVINVNNTHTLLGVYDGDRLAVHWRLRTDQARTVDEYGVLLRGLFADWGVPQPAITGIILASVVPPMNERVEQLCARFFGHARRRGLQEAGDAAFHEEELARVYDHWAK